LIFSLASLNTGFFINGNLCSIAKICSYFKYIIRYDVSLIIKYFGIAQRVFNAEETPGYLFIQMSNLGHFQNYNEI